MRIESNKHPAWILVNKDIEWYRFGTDNFSMCHSGLFYSRLVANNETFFETIVSK